MPVPAGRRQAELSCWLEERRRPTARWQSPGSALFSGTSSVASKYEELECLYAAVGKVIYEGLTNYEKATNANPSQLFGECLPWFSQRQFSLAPTSLLTGIRRGFQLTHGSSVCRWPGTHRATVPCGLGGDWPLLHPANPSRCSRLNLRCGMWL